MKRVLLLSAITMVLAGCATSGSVYVSHFGPPPPPRYAVVGVAPGPGYVWCDGYWTRRGSHWGWVDGRWARPPRARAVWVPGSWYEERGRWRFRQGYWR